MSSDTPIGESTDPEVAVDKVEGLTDRPTLARPRSEETQVAQLPERPTTPATEIVHSVAPARPESGPARASAPATEIVPPITGAGFGPDELPDLPAHPRRPARPPSTRRSIAAVASSTPSASRRWRSSPSPPSIS
jgi:hypothetical protein